VSILERYDFIFKVGKCLIFEHVFENFRPHPQSIKAP